jgi:hypothetical protein
MIEIGMKNHRSLQYCKIIRSNISYKEWQMMLGLRVVLMTLHGWFTISIEQDK